MELHSCDTDLSTIISKRFEYDLNIKSRKKEDKKLEKDVGQVKIVSDSRVKIINTQKYEPSKKIANNLIENHKFRFIMQLKKQNHERDFKLSWSVIKINAYSPQTRDCATWIAVGNYF